MFLLSVWLARPRLDEAFPIAQRKSARSIHNCFRTGCRWTLCSLAGLSCSSFSQRSQRSVGALERGHVELLQRAFHMRGINSEVVPCFVFFNKVRPK